MRRTAAVLAVALAAGLGAASTASNSVPASTAGYQAVKVTGATMKSISYTTAANTITALTLKLKGPQVRLGVTLFSNVSARFGSGTTVTCAIGLYDVLTDSTTVTCTPFTQRANASWTLQITVS